MSIEEGFAELDMTDLRILKDNMTEFILVISFKNNTPAEK